MPTTMLRQAAVALISALIGLLASAVATEAVAEATSPDPRNWPAIIDKAKGQSVYWYAWGGSQAVNDYIGWVGAEMEARYSVVVNEVKLGDTAEAVSRVLAEKTAGRDQDGAVDLIWINGPNFAAMKEKGLLFGPFAEALPNWRYVDVEGKPGQRSDFTVPTGGYEAPWNMAQIVFYGDGPALAAPPASAKALLDWTKAHPGRFAYPDPANFLGASFLKQVLIELTPDRARLQQPVDDKDFDSVTAPLFAYLDALEPNLWRQGRAYPANSSALLGLMADGEIDLALSFNPAEASSAIARGRLPPSVRSFVFDKGTIGNASFVAIPYNAGHKEGALLLADFLLSPEAQAKKQDPTGFGGFTVLSMAKLSAEDRVRFEALPRGIATLSTEELGPTLPEPHPSWMTRIVDAWKRRYGVR
ncbi:putative thiamine transport system substrate-binding protein [Rhizobiales bacterium GAS113]|nr:putative thiamine transport system substrate-binding protein [Rhizobiales bacterium GAS113]